MTIVEHLTELRTRLIVSLVAVAVGAVVGWLVYEPVFRLLTSPFVQACRQLAPEIRPPQGCEQALIVVSVTEPFLIRFKVSVFTGLGIALPVVLYQLWRFITPGLTRRERRLAIPFVLSSVVLFALGTWFAFITLPRALAFLLGFAGTTLTPLLTVDRYVGFVLVLILAFGLTFEFPLLLVFLSLVRVITSRQMRRWRRYAYLSVTIVAAVVTPSQDPYTLLAMALPMVLFYELAIIVARLFKR
ncbi:MAG: twin-arginine translocase subunit TatC [Actinobacteria bacterium]|nr:twin-arginine translocase subunit TatC [Actinomycetota bacterium]